MRDQVTGSPLSVSPVSSVLGYLLATYRFYSIIAIKGSNLLSEIILILFIEYKLIMLLIAALSTYFCINSIKSLKIVQK